MLFTYNINDTITLSNYCSQDKLSVPCIFIIVIMILDYINSTMRSFLNLVANIHDTVMVKRAHDTLGQCLYTDICLKKPG